MAFNTEIRIPVGDEKLTVSNAAAGVSLSASKYAPEGNIGCGADLAVLTASGDAFVFRVTGLAPDATTGHIIPINTPVTVYGLKAIQNLKMIRVTNDSTVFVTYYRREGA